MRQESLVYRTIASLLAILMITSVLLPIPVAQALETKKTEFSSPIIPENFGISNISETPQYTVEDTLVIHADLSSYVLEEDVTNIWINLSITNFENKTVENIVVHDYFLDGITILSSLPLPSMNGSELIWSIGDLTPFSSENVSILLEVNSSTSVFTTIDAGFVAYGTVDGEPVYSNLSSITLIPSSFSQYIESTPDANITDSYIILQSQLLGNNPEDIFEFVRDEVEYESYNGSLRGARGTLWSMAGNSMDQSSLLIALLRAVGIPCRYAHGTLSNESAQKLIASMFPTPDNVIGSVPEGLDVADPINDTKLLLEAKNHTWVEYYSNGEWVSLDPSFKDSEIGDSFCMIEERFTEIPDFYRHKVTFKLKLEKGRSSISYPLTLTKGTPELYGEKIVLGHDLNIDEECTFEIPFVGCMEKEARIIYSPYLMIGDKKYYGSNFKDIYKQSVGSDSVTKIQQYTGEWLQFIVDDLTEQSIHERTIFDKVGYVNRKKGTPVSIDINVSVSPLDLFTMVVVPGKVPVFAKNIEMLEFLPVLNKMNETYFQFENKNWTDLTNEEKKLLIDYTVGTEYSMLLEQCGISDFITGQYATLYLIKSYFDTPRIIIISLNKLDTVSVLSIDLRKNNIRAIIYPQQPDFSLILFRQARGFSEASIEGEVIRQFNQTVITVPDVFMEAKKQNISSRIIMPVTKQEMTMYVDNITVINISDDDKSILISNALIIPTYNISEIMNMNISDEAKYRVIDALESGRGVIIPEEMVRIGNITTIAWWEIDPETGEIIGVFENGLYFSFWPFIYSFLYGLIYGFLIQTLLIIFTDYLPWFLTTFHVYIYLTSSYYAMYYYGHNMTGIQPPTWKDAKLYSIGNYQWLNKLLNRIGMKTVEEISKEFEIENPKDVAEHLLSGLAHLADFYKLYGSVGGHTRWLNYYIKTGRVEKVTQKIIQLGRARTKAAYTGVWKHLTLTKVGVIGSSFLGGIVGGYIADNTVGWAVNELKKDPPLSPILITPNVNITHPFRVPSTVLSSMATIKRNYLLTDLKTTHNKISGNQTASWNSTVYSSLDYNKITSQKAEIFDLNNNLVETGNASIQPINNETGIFGEVSYLLSGNGSQSFYAPASNGFGVGGNWSLYNISVTGNFTIDALDASISVNETTLNGHYLINTTNANINGSGLTAIPSFAGKVEINATDCNVIIGDSSGTLLIGNSSLDPGEGISLTGFTGTLSIEEFNSTHNEIVANGEFDRYLATYLEPKFVTTTHDSNITLTLTISSNEDDEYNVTASVPDNWGVIVSNDGTVLVIPEQGATPGEYRVSVTTVSTTEPDLISTAISTIEIQPVKGVEVEIEKDELITVPLGDNIYNSIPSAFNVNIKNKGNNEDTFQITATGLPEDWILLSMDKVTIPGGRTFSTGLYIKPNDTIMPTSQTFTVTVKSVADPSVSDSDQATFEMSEYRNVDVNVTPKVLYATPNGSVTFKLVVTSKSNTDDVFNISIELPEKLNADYTKNAPLSIGENLSQDVTVTTTNTNDGEIYFIGVLSESIFNENASDYEVLSLYITEELVNDSTPPIITNVSVSSIATDSAIIKWETDELSDSLVKYGIESGNYTEYVYEDVNVTTHVVSVTGLNSDTTYYFVVNSTDKSGNSNESLELMFKTIKVSGCGDVNCNNDINMGDVILLLNNVTYGYPLCSEWSGDVNCDTKINMGDVILLLNNVTYGYGLNCCKV